MLINCIIATSANTVESQNVKLIVHSAETILRKYGVTIPPVEVDDAGTDDDAVRENTTMRR